MTDNPIELLAAMESSWEAMDESAREDQRRIRRAEIAALEAAGFRIVHPEGVTEEVLTAMAECYDPTWDYASADVSRDWAKNSFQAAIALAPTYATPAAPQKE